MARLNRNPNETNVLPFTGGKKKVNVLMILAWLNLSLVVGLYVIVLIKA